MKGLCLMTMYSNASRSCAIAGLTILCVFALRADDDDAPRPGIVHRLDRDTSGVMVVAKTDPMHFALAAQFEARTTEKEYFAITVGIPASDRDFVAQPMGVHPH